MLPDGREVSPIDWPTHWWGSQRDVTIREVASLYQDIQPHECLALGGAPHGRVVTNLPRTEFKLPPANLMVVDVDGMPYVEGYSDATLRADPENTIRAQLVAMFTERVVGKVHIVVALSSRAGFTGDFRAHVWIGLVENYAAKDIAAWQRSRPVEWIDKGIFQAGRVLFAAPPQIDHDPFPIRVFEFAGDPGSALVLPLKSTEGLVPLSCCRFRGRAVKLTRPSFRTRPG